jgi:hypothetical protein
MAKDEAQPAQEPVALHAMAKRRVFDAIRGAYDLGYNDARSARAVHGDSAPGYKGRDVEEDHGGALISALERYTNSPAAQRQWVGLTDEEFDDLRDNNFGVSPLISAVEAKLKEKNAAAQPAVPDALNPKDENPAYAAGWNDCRAVMMEMMKGMK